MSENGNVNPAFDGEPSDASRDRNISGHGSQGFQPIDIVNGHDALPSTKAGSPVDQNHSEGIHIEEVDDELCKWGPIRPDCCQILRNAKIVLFVLCCSSAIQGLVINGFVNVVVSTIERRFGLQSQETGLIVSSYDIASVLCLIPVTYFGGAGCKPRWLGAGLILMGIGSFVFAIPHYTTDLYEIQGLTNSNLCSVNGTLTDSCRSEIGRRLSNYKYVLIVAQLLHGAGASPLYTLGVTFIDDNVKVKMSSLYLGIYYTMSIIGPAIGFLLGGYLLNFYCDFDSVASASLTIEPDDPQWVGAWWLGFLLSGLLSILVAIPLIGFPNFLPGSAQLRAERISEAYKGSKVVVADTAKGVIMNLPHVLKVLLTNPTFIFLNLAGASEGLLLTGFSTFTPKFIEAQFSTTAGYAALLVGFATIPAGGGGTFLGGYLVKKFNMKCAKIIKFCIITVLIGLVASLVFLVGCPLPKYAGVNTMYLHPNISLEESQLIATCNSDCNCTTEQYDPTCGADDILYFSPCHAGCNSYNTTSGIKVYRNCSCIEATWTNMTGDGLNMFQAQSGKCSTDCQLLYVFLPIFAVAILLTFMTSMPALSATLRCVPESHKSFALGIQWVIMRCLGTIPGPIVFGSLLDKSCELWQDTCGERGSCSSYDNNSMGIYIMTLSLCGKAASFIFFILALFLYRPPPSNSTSTDQITDTNRNIRTAHDNKAYDVAESPTNDTPVTTL